MTREQELGKWALEIYRWAKSRRPEDPDEILSTLPHAVRYDLPPVDGGRQASVVERAAARLLTLGSDDGDPDLETAVAVVESALQALSERDRLILTLRHLAPDRWTLTEIAHRLAVPASSVSRWYLRAVGRIGEKILAAQRKVVDNPHCAV